VLILARAALAIAHAHRWYPEQQIKNLFLRAKHWLREFVWQIRLRVERPLRIENAPGLVLTRQKRWWKAEWKASVKGFRPRKRYVARLPINPHSAEMEYVAHWCSRLQAEMQRWEKGIRPKRDPEPTMEEILASIRRIIADDASKPTTS
jgi:hypothetical protein